ncbi:helix-turn-helix domain-containing protein [Aeromonas veronii]|uniref:helix-turn-helix domain-containing protein n=1 Tax=Aeromonas veronii TaxID=654 RepID=UPI003B981FEE
MTTAEIVERLQACRTVELSTRDITPTNIRAAREALDIPVGVMAMRLGVDRDTYSKWERGVCQPSASAVTTIRWFLAGRVL